jgi:hypothetical protein
VKGLVVEVEGKYAILLNKKGQFVKIKNNGKHFIGQEVEGRLYRGFDQGNIKSSMIKMVASIAAVFVLASGLGYGVYKVPASYAYVDINPSIELTANIFDRVIDVKGLNNDGKSVTVAHKILNESLQDGIKDIVAGAIEEGYLKEGSDGVVVITVAGKDENKVIKIEDESYKAVSKELQDKNLQTEVIVQSALIDKKKEAEKVKLEARIESLENEIRELDLAMAAGELGYEELNKLYCRKDDLSKDLEAAMEIWLSFNS